MSQSETKSKPAGADKESGGFFARLGGALGESLLPKPTYFEGEVTQQVIHMAPYRASVPKYFAFLGFLLLFGTIFGFAFVSFNTPESEATATNTPVETMALDTSANDSSELTSQQKQVLSNIEMMSWLGLIATVFVFFKAFQSALAYQQWQFITTDKRIIITTPDPDRGLFADAIYLKNDTIKVLDTNFSKSPVWAPFQILTGARDVMLSTGAYAFMEKGAKVKDGIRFPDVTLQDIKLLEKLVFGGKK